MESVRASVVTDEGDRRGRRWWGSYQSNSGQARDVLSQRCRGCRGGARGTGGRDDDGESRAVETVNIKTLHKAFVRIRVFMSCVHVVLVSFVIMAFHLNVHIDDHDVDLDIHLNIHLDVHIDGTIFSGTHYMGHNESSFLCARACMLDTVDEDRPEDVERGDLDTVDEDVERGDLDTVDEYVERGVLDTVDEDVERGVLDTVDEDVGRGGLDTVDEDGDDEAE